MNQHIDFIRHEWAKETNSKRLFLILLIKTGILMIVFDILNLSEINKDSALDILEVYLILKDKGSAFTTVNSKFIDM